MIRIVAASLLALAAATAAEPRFAPLFGHEGALRAATLDGSVAATADPRLRLWNLEDGSLLWMEAGAVAEVDGYQRVECRLGAEVVVAIRGLRVHVFDRRDGSLRWERTSTYGHGLRTDGRVVLLPAQNGYDVLAAGDGTVQGRLPSGEVAFAPDGSAILLRRQDVLVLAERSAAGWKAGEPMPHPPLVSGDTPERGSTMLIVAGDGRPRLLTADRIRSTPEQEAAAEQASMAGEVQPGGDVLAAWWTLPVAADAKPERSAVLHGLRTVPDRILADGTLLAQDLDDWHNPPMQLVKPGTDRAVDRPGPAAERRMLAGSPDGRRLLMAGGQPPAVEAAADGDQVLIELLGPAPAPGAVSMVRSGDGRRLAVSTPVGIAVWDLALLRLERWLPGRISKPVAAGPLPGLATWDDEGWWYDADDSPVRLLDLDGNRPWVSTLKAQAPGCAASPDGRWLAALVPGALVVHDAATGVLRTRIALAMPGDNDFAGLLAWTPGGDLLAVRAATREYVIDGGYERTPSQWSAVALHADGSSRRQDGKGTVDDALALLPGAVAALRTGPAAEVQAGSGAWWAGIAATRGPLGEVELRRGSAPPVRLLASPEAWVVWSDDGWFDGSRSAARLLAAQVDGRRIALDEAVRERCRPERLLALLGCDDQALLRSAARREKAAEAAARPTVTVSGSRLEQGRLHIDASASANGGPDLAGIDAWVDGVPQTGAPAAGASAKAGIEVGLPPWPATVEVAARNAAGAVSWRARVPVPPGAMVQPRVVAACLGVSRYRDPALVLRYAAKDALDVGLALDAMRPGTEQALVRSWTDAEVTASALAEVRGHLAAAGPQDLVVLYVAGHGLWLRDPQPMWHLLPVGATAADPGAGAIPWTALAGVLDGCRSLRRLIILDTCESGVLDDDAPTGAGLSIAGARGLRTRAQAVAAGLAGAWLARDRERLVTADLARSTGAVVLASSRGGEPSFESEADANGLFTQELLSALHGAADVDHDGWITTGELVARVAATVSERSGGRQRPTIDRDNPLAAIRLPVLPATP